MMGSSGFEVGSKHVLNNDREVKILKRFKGSISNKTNMQSGVMFTGFKSKPCTYLLSDGRRMRGATLSKILK